MKKIKIKEQVFQFVVKMFPSTWLGERFFKKSFSIIASLITVFERKSCKKKHDCEKIWNSKTISLIVFIADESQQNLLVSVDFHIVGRCQAL